MVVDTHGKISVKDLDTSNINAEPISTLDAGKRSDLLINLYDDSGSSKMEVRIHHDTTPIISFSDGEEPPGANNVVIENLLPPQSVDGDNECGTVGFTNANLIGGPQMLVLPTSLQDWTPTAPLPAVPGDNNFVGSINANTGIYSSSTNNRKGFAIVNVPINYGFLTQYVEFELIHKGNASGNVENTTALNFGFGIINREDYLAISTTNNNWVTSELLSGTGTETYGINPKLASYTLRQYSDWNTSNKPWDVLVLPNDPNTWLNQGLTIQLGANLREQKVELIILSNDLIVARHMVSGVPLHTDRKYYFMVWRHGGGNVSPEIRLTPSIRRLGYYAGGTVGVSSYYDLGFAYATLPNGVNMTGGLAVPYANTGGDNWKFTVDISAVQDPVWTLGGLGEVIIDGHEFGAGAGNDVLFIYNFANDGVNVANGLYILADITGVPPTKITFKRISTADNVSEYNRFMSVTIARDSTGSNPVDLGKIFYLNNDTRSNLDDKMTDLAVDEQEWLEYDWTMASGLELGSDFKSTCIII